MFEITTKWHKASEELPERSCKVIIFKSDFTGVWYSAKWKKFNSSDFYKTLSQANRVAINDVIYWAYADEILAAIEKSAESYEQVKELIESAD